MVNVPVSSGSCVSHPSSKGSSDKSTHSLTGSLTTSAPTGAKPASIPVYETNNVTFKTFMAPLSGATAAASMAAITVLRSKACKDLSVCVYVGITIEFKDKKMFLNVQFH